MTDDNGDDDNVVDIWVARLSRDLREAAKSMTAPEARFLVDAYYTMQQNRIRSANQVRALGESEEPHMVLEWLKGNAKTMEDQIKAALDRYSAEDPVGAWCRKTVGVGPVIAAGLIAHIDIEKAPTVGHIWRFAGLDPTVVWGKGERRPWNADLKTLCWKLGESFVKVSGNQDAFYGQHYVQRKAYEVERNESGGNAETAAKLLTEKKWNKTTDAFKHLTEGHLPPGQIHGRAKRWTVKLFLAHMHGFWYEHHYKKPPPLPYAIAHLPGHVHEIKRAH